MTKKIMVFGSAAVDLTARTPHLPTPAETVRGTAFMQGAGGKGFNQAVAAHRAGGDVVLVTKLGRDSLSEVPLGLMERIGLSREFLRYHDTLSTGVALICVDETTSQNQIVIVPGACGAFDEADIAAAAALLDDCEYVLLQLEINRDANEKLAAIAKEKGVRVVVNTAPYQPVSDEFLRGTWLVTPNEVEAEEMTGIRIDDLASADRAAEALHRRGVQNVLITLGSRGVYLNADGRSEIIPAYRVEAVDTTGAGDAFNGGLMTALAEGRPLREAARFANALAALSVQRPGAAPSMPSRKEIDAFLQNR